MHILFSFTLTFYIYTTPPSNPSHTSHSFPVIHLPLCTLLYVSCIPITLNLQFLKFSTTALLFFKNSEAAITLLHLLLIILKTNVNKRDRHTG